MAGIHMYEVQYVARIPGNKLVLRTCVINATTYPEALVEIQSTDCDYVRAHKMSRVPSLTVVHLRERLLAEGV